MIATIFGLFIFSTVRGNLFQPACFSNRNRARARARDRIAVTRTDHEQEHEHDYEEEEKLASQTGGGGVKDFA